MLQIIIWLGCTYLAVKGLDMVRAAATSGENVFARVVSLLGAGLAFIAVPIFFMLAQGQAEATNPMASQLGTLGISGPLDGDQAAAANAMEAMADNMEAQADALEKGTR